MNVKRILVTGLVAGAAAWAAAPALAQSKKAPAKDIEPTAVAKPDQADLDRSQIIGNRELPKVTYIVPWKKPGAGDLSGRPLVERPRRGARAGRSRGFPPPGPLRRAGDRPDAGAGRAGRARPAAPAK